MLVAIASLALVAASPPSGPELRHLELESGVSLRYAVQGPAWGRPVVMLHGFTDSWQSFELLLDRLPSDIRAVVPDLRGHGGSSRPPRGYRMEQMAEDVIGLLESLNLRRVTLVGHSMGSFVAREVARRLPDRVAGLVLIGSGPVLGNAVIRGLAEELAEMTDSIPLGYIVAFQQGTVARAVDPGFMGRVVAASRSVPAATWRAVALAMARHHDRVGLDALRVPILVIGGERDTIFPPTEQESLFAQVREGQKSIYPGVGHAPHWEVPDQVATDLQRFMVRFFPPPPGAEER